MKAKALSTEDILNISYALSTAVEARFFPEQLAKSILKEYLRNSGFDVIEQKPERK